MIKKTTMWAVTRSFMIETKTVIVEDGKILAAKDSNANDDRYEGEEYNVLQYCESEEEAKAWIEHQEKEILEMVTKVKKFITQMDYTYSSSIRERLGIKKEHYLGTYAKDSESNLNRCYKREREYNSKLETFIRSRMLDIDGHMIPIDEIKDVEWNGLEDADEYECGEWKAVVTTKDGNEYSTGSSTDVRLIMMVIGKPSDQWFIDEDIDYDK